MKSYWIYVTLLILVGIALFFLMNYSGSGDTNNQESSAYVDPEVYKNLETTELVKNGVTYTTTLDGRTYTSVTVITETNKAQDVINSLVNPDDFIPSQHVFESSFSVGITKSGVEKLKRNPSVIKVEVIQRTSQA